MPNLRRRRARNGSAVMAKQICPYLPIYTIHQDPTRLYRPLGLVVQHKTEGMGVIRDLVARLKDFTGGRVGAYDRSVNGDLIFPTLRELSNQAHEIYTVEGVGPDAIVGLIMNVQSVPSKGMAMMQITVYGTAVRYLTPEEEAEVKKDERGLLQVLGSLVETMRNFMETIRDFMEEVRRWWRGEKDRADSVGSRDDHAMRS